MKLNKIHTVYLATIIFLLCGTVIYIVRMPMPKDKNIAKITSGMEVVDTIDLSKVTEPYEFEIKNDRGYNKVRVEQGRIAVIEADCPDKVCVNQGYITAGDLPIVCLPHKLTIAMTDSGEIDAVAGR